MNIFKDKRTRVFMLVMVILVLLAIVIAGFWFRYENGSTDPRVVDARNLYAGYNKLTQQADNERILQLLDSIEGIYIQMPLYAASYEVGVLYNNRAAVYLTQAIATAPNDSVVKDSLLFIAETMALKSKSIYAGWLKGWGNLSEDATLEMLNPHFKTDDPVFGGRNAERFIRKRAKEIREARFETPRRLSATLTNLGMIYRHQRQYDKAAKTYLAALELWEDNLAAENNLNILMNKPLKKRSLFRKIFPKNRREF